MSGTVAKLPFIKPDRDPHIITLTPEIATSLLERNGLNRPLSEQHVQRIANQIKQGKWRFNGDTIKIAETNDVLDGQHRLWAVIEAKKPVETVVIHGIAKDAFATIDTISKPRSGSDVLALNGANLHRKTTAEALKWLIRWQRKCLPEFRAPKHRVENSDIEEAFAAHPRMIHAAERANRLRRVANPSIMAFLYYITTNRNPELAEQMMETLENPARMAMTHPFFLLRSYFMSNRDKNKEPLVTVALVIKALNAAHKKRSLQKLVWRHQGERAEDLPILEI